MKVINKSILTLLFIVLFSTLSLRAAEFKGYQAIDNIVKTRLLVSGSTYEMSKEGTRGNFLYLLLGSYVDSRELGPFPYFLDPQPLNMGLWNQVIQRFSIVVASACNNRHLNPNPSAEIFNFAFFELILKACDFPTSQTLSREYLDVFWGTVVFYDAPLIEREEWKDFMIEKFANQAGKEFLKAAIQSAMLNPYFLLTP